ncbi:CBO0543 family protein [Anaerosolibacter sp.]|uniref:CBO0543 family protein n=1 Tax=Anaerosolibacter sp. TaxID=1872527 RepID=UPI0039F0AC0E
MNSEEALFQKLVENRRLGTQISLELWLKHEVFTWQWCISLALFIFPYIILWKIVDRKRILEIAVYGLHINIFATLLDVIGSEVVYWKYIGRLIPTPPALLPYDFTVLPMALMAVYQKYPKWKDFIIANTIVSALFSFVAEPLLILLDMYKPLGWKHYYSFPIYILLAVFSKWLVQKFKEKQQSEFIGEK